MKPLPQVTEHEDQEFQFDQVAVRNFIKYSTGINKKHLRQFCPWQDRLSLLFPGQDPRFGQDLDLFMKPFPQATEHIDQEFQFDQVA